jgi:hypothetical protein
VPGSTGRPPACKARAGAAHCCGLLLRPLESFEARPLSPIISIDDVTRLEANAVATFTVTLSAQSEKPISLRASTVASTATPGSSCAAGVDYLTLANVAVAFSPGQLSQPLNVGICADAQDEFNETASVFLSQLSNATAGDVSGVLTILDNDP